MKKNYLFQSRGKFSPPPSQLHSKLPIKKQGDAEKHERVFTGWGVGNSATLYFKEDLLKENTFSLVHFAGQCL
jgi:hypothetical protein